MHGIGDNGILSKGRSHGGQSVLLSAEPPGSGTTTVAD